MKLTDAERLILLNQYRILAKLDPDMPENRHAIEELEQGLYEVEQHACPSLPPPISADKSDFAWNVMQLYEREKRREPFYGFQDERLNACVRYWGGRISKKGPPLPDDQYLAMLEKEQA